MDIILAMISNILLHYRLYNLSNKNQELKISPESETGRYRWCHNLEVYMCLSLPSFNYSRLSQITTKHRHTPFCRICGKTMD